MKTIFVLSVALASINVALAQEKWVETTSKEGGFKVLFPVKAQYQTSESNAPSGKMKRHLFYGGTNNNSHSFAVTYMDFHAADFEQMGREAILEHAQKLAARTYVEAKISGEKEIKIGGNPGIEYVLEGESKTNGKNSTTYMRSFMKGSRLYGVYIIVSTPIEAETRKKFFDSFELLGK